MGRRMQGDTAMPDAFYGRAVPSLLDVYEAACSCDLEEFETRAIRQLGVLVGFDGAVWGAGVRGGMQVPLTITRAAIVDRPAQLLPDYALVAAKDHVTARFLNDPGNVIAVQVNSDYASAAEASVRDYLSHYNIGQLMLLGRCTRGLQPGAGILRWITAYRESPMAAFDAQDITRFSCLLPHWLAAHQICTTLKLGRNSGKAGVEAGFALCDAGGLIHSAEGGFRSLTCLGEGCLIAAETARQMVSTTPGYAVIGNAGVTARSMGSWRILSARSLTAHNALTARETEVARRYVAGYSHKQIARELRLSPATVRTQLQCVYRKLAVHSRIELLRALGQT